MPVTQNPEHLTDFFLFYSVPLVVVYFIPVGCTRKNENTSFSVLVVLESISQVG